jgi:predicted O-linked N-acetylglucosamine transferase (SPINDLY family)
MTVLAKLAIEQLTANDPARALVTLALPVAASEFASLGIIHIVSEEWQAAYAAFRRARELGDTSPVTQLNLALVEDRLGLDGRARMRALARHSPNWDEPTLRLAESYRRAKENSQACSEYERTLERNPNRVEALLALAILYLGFGEAVKAQMLLLRCCGIAPRMAEAWDALGLSLLATHDAAIAESAFGEAQRLKPENIEFALRRADASYIAGSAEGELARLEIATDVDPLDVAQLTARGALLDRLGRSDEAADILETAVLLAPESPLPTTILANSLLHLSRFSEAIPYLRKANELSPENLALKSDYAATLNRAHRYTEAKEILERMIAEHGDQPAMLCNLCNSLVSLGLQREGVEMALRATRAAPELHLPWRTLCAALAYCENVSAAEVFDACRKAGSTVTRGRTDELSLQMDKDSRTQGRRLRLGLLSPNLRTHPVGWLTVAAFEGLKPENFELVCFAQVPSDDTMSRRFRTASTAWHSVIGQTPTAIAATIRRANIDILIDLGGWGDQGALPACALRPAPVQMKWVGGQFHSTGLSEIDWFITDRWQTPVGSEQLYCERLLRLPDGYVCYSTPPNAPEIGQSPADITGFVTFGCFNNLAKINRSTIAAWSRILQRVSNSRLLLKTHQFSDPITVGWIQAMFGKHGIDASRIICRGSSSHRGQLAQHADIDIALDPFPYSGGLTTCEALWMGVPVVATFGETFASRHSASHLNNVGMADWIGDDVQSYVEIAVERAHDLRRLRGLRAALRDMMKRSALCDSSRFGTNLGAALTYAWQQYLTNG